MNSNSTVPSTVKQAILRAEAERRGRMGGKSVAPGKRYRFTSETARAATRAREARKLAQQGGEAPVQAVKRLLRQRKASNAGLVGRSVV